MLALPALDLGAVSVVAAFMLSVTVAAVGGGLWGGLDRGGARVAARSHPRGARPRAAVRRAARRRRRHRVLRDRAWSSGSSSGNAADERARATQREREARLLAQLSVAAVLGGGARARDGRPRRAAARAARAVVVHGRRGARRRSRSTPRPPAPGRRRRRARSVTVPIAVGRLDRSARSRSTRPAARSPALAPGAAAPRGGGAPGRRGAGPRAARRAGAPRAGRRRDEPAARVDVQLGDPRPADARSRRSRRASRASSTGRTAYSEAQRHELLHDDPGGDRPAQPAGRQHPRPREDPCGSAAPAARRASRSTRSSRRSSAGCVRGSRPPTSASTSRCRRTLPEIPVDAVQIDQVLTNLLENALRHSPSPGAVHVGLSVIPRGVRVRVTDQGPGVAPRRP